MTDNWRSLSTYLKDIFSKCIILNLQSFASNIYKDLFHYLLVSVFFDKKITVIGIVVPLYICHFSLPAFIVFLYFWFLRTVTTWFS